MLEKIGYKVLKASSGQEALSVYEKESDHIDMVLLDIIMPGLGGGEAFDQLKEINKDVKVLLSSGYSIDDQAAEILKKGCSYRDSPPTNAGGAVSRRRRPYRLINNCNRNPPILTRWTSPRACLESA